MQEAVREGMVDVYVALKRLKRTGKAARPVALSTQALHATLMSMAQQYPDNVTVT
jgi:hypothetical protein